MNKEKKLKHITKWKNKSVIDVLAVILVQTIMGILFIAAADEFRVILYVFYIIFGFAVSICVISILGFPKREIEHIGE